MKVRNGYEILRRLCEAFGPSGAEEEVAVEIRAILGKGFQYYTTPHGNLVAVARGRGGKTGRGGRRRTLVLQAHMDELGFRPFRYLPDGFIQVSPLSYPPDEVANHLLLFKPGDARGLLVLRKEGAHTRFFLDCGAADADEAMRQIPYHANGAYCSAFGMSETQMIGKSFDDRAGCALIVETLLAARSSSRAEVVGVFTTREEFGCWPIAELQQTIQEADLKPDLLVNLEVCPGGPTPAYHDPILHIGKGVGLVHMDKYYACPPSVCRFMVELAEARGVPYQHVAMREGGGELGSLALNLGVHGYSLVIPGRYMHSPHSVISHHDYDAAKALLAALAEEF